MLAYSARNIHPEEVEDGEPKLCSRTSWVQAGYGWWVNQTIVSVGLALGFSAVAVPALGASDRDAGFPVTQAERAWIASVLPLCSPLGCMISGHCIDRFGRRPLMILCMAPMSFGWLYTGFARGAGDMILGRAVTGVGVGMAVAPPYEYGTEISLPKMRGLIGVLPSVALALGVTIQAALGALLQWRPLCYISGGYCTLLMVLNWFLPETPYFVLMKGSLVQAQETLAKFRGKHYNTDDEMDDLRDFKETNQLRRLSPLEALRSLCSPQACKPFSVMLGYMLFGELAGITVMVFYSIEILQESKSLIDPYLGNMLMGLTRLLAGVVTVLFVYREQRRVLALISAAGLCASSVAAGVVELTWGGGAPSVVSPAACVLYTAFATLGYYTLPLLMLFELIPLQIRGLLGGISISILNLLMFATTGVFPYVKNYVGISHLFIGFGVFSFFGFIYIYFFLPETKGLTLQEIEEFYNKRRMTLSHSPSRSRSTKRRASSRPRPAPPGARLPAPATPVLY